MILAFLTKYKWALAGLAALVLVTAVIAGIASIRASAYQAGRAFERSEWEAVLQQAQDRARNAELALGQQIIAREEESRQRALSRTVVIHRTRENIANATDTQARYAAYIDLRNSLRSATAERFARARADYLSTVNATN